MNWENADMSRVGWGTDINESNNLLSYPHHWEVKKWSFLSGILVGEIAIVLDTHFVPEWKENAVHFNVRLRCNRSIDGRIPKIDDFPLPSELTQRHYKFWELEKIIGELFKLKK